MSPTNFILIFILVVQYVRGKEVDLFTSAERTALNQLQAKLSGIHLIGWESTDDYLLRWLQAGDMNVEAAYKMFIENLIWRRKNKIETIRNETIFQFIPPPVYLDGYDKEGYPLIFFAPTHIDARRLIVQGQRPKLIRYWYQILEKGAERARNAPILANRHNVTKSTAILDLHGYNLRQHFCIECISVYREWFIGAGKYYPETVRHFIVINVQRVAATLVQVIRPILPPSYARVLKIFSVDKKEYSKFLLTIIDPEQLPYQYGGTKKTPAIG